MRQALNSPESVLTNVFHPLIELTAGSEPLNCFLSEHRNKGD